MSDLRPTADPLPEFPPGFRWSTATSAFQIEGARDIGGRGRSIWDDFVDSGRIIDGTTAEEGPQSYHRWGEDVALLRGLGADRYRFSISWVRVQPDGLRGVNAAGLDYYSRLVDDLLNAGITPFPTLYHWDLPSPLEAQGGWLNRDTALRFADYARLVADRLADRVRHWYTINEPAMTTLQGYAVGTLAPGRTMLFDALPTAHHQLLAHGLALRVLRAAGAHEVAIANNHTFVRPLHDTEEDAGAAAVYDVLHNRLFADPVLSGHYPDFAALGLPDLPIRDGDLELISAPLDVYGVNFYNPTTVTADSGPVPFAIVPTPGAPVTGFGQEWPIVPESLTALLVQLRERYGSTLPPVVVSENGASFPEPDEPTSVNDQNRIAYLEGHIAAVGEAIRAGVVVDEYTVWSLLDNFEWADGFTQRFGLVHTDVATGTRTPKASYRWYRDLIARSRA
ncbi:GH1 family beta-glucosidase [Microbacterium gorillae]|uniref:GH1 family beta-glucosidase n=1 Tax=Microbacterium gorillae TaxID=1231063 RepID=UPI003D98D43C